MFHRDQRLVTARTPFGWEGVEPEGYVPGDDTRVYRYTIVGHRKEDPAEPGPDLELRYFVVPPGSVTRFEKHEHEHYVIIGEGIGRAIVDEYVRIVRPRDVVYVPPLIAHQFINDGKTTLGFFCIVSAARDYSQAIVGDELARLLASPAGKYIDVDGAPPPRKAASR